MKRALIAIVASLTLAGALAGASETISHTAPSAALSLGDGSCPTPMIVSGTVAYGDSTSR
jgi:hypothetical protein